MEKGTLYYNAREDRIAIYFNTNDYYGFHCGDCLEVFSNGAWRGTRVEFCHENVGYWYLVGIDEKNINGLIARI